MFNRFRNKIRAFHFIRLKPSLLILVAGVLVATGFVCQSTTVVSALTSYKLVPVRQRKTTGPLSVSADNSRYFMDRNGDVVYLTGSHFWLNLQNGGLSYPPRRFDYGTWLNFLVANNHNFFRLWTWEEAKWTTEHPSSFYFYPNAYQRTGPGKALDGKLKFDVTKYNQAYFSKMRKRVIAARDRGIYVSVMLFDGWSISYPKGNNGQQNPWQGHPFNASNNINGIDGDPNHNSSGDEIQTLAIPAVTALQDAYVKKVIDSVHDLDNVLFEISNESNVGAEAWQYHMIDLIKSYETEMGYLHHPVGMTAEWPDGNNADLYASQADWISPNGGLDPIPAADGSKVVIADTDHLCGICGSRDWAWGSFTRGQNPLFMDQYNDSYKLDGGGYRKNNPNDVSLRRNLGYTLTFANCMDLASMTPRGDLASSDYALANPSGAAPEYLVYFPWYNQGWVDLSGTPVQMSSIWFNPVNGRYYKGQILTGGGVRDVAAPFSGSAVLYLHAANVATAQSAGAAGPAPDSVDANNLSNLKNRCFR